MCLFSKKKTMEVATEDIVCYKFLKQDRIFSEDVYTPIANCLVDEKFLSGETPFYADKQHEHVVEFPYSKFGDIFEIGDGFIHTFQKEEDIKSYVYNKFCSSIYFNTYWYAVIYRCVIPKGTRYYVDIDNEQYASDCIIFKEKIF